MGKSNKELAAEISGMKETETMLSEKINGLTSENESLTKQVSDLNAVITERDNKIAGLQESNSLLSDSLTQANEKLSNELNRKSYQENKNNVDDSNTQSIEPGMTVTPKEDTGIFQKGYNAFVKEVNGDEMIVTNKDNPAVHRNETKVKTNAFRIVATLFLMFFLSFIASAQIDTVGSGDLVSNTESIVNAIFGILDFFGISISPFRTIILAIVLFIVRRIEKNMVKQKAASEVRAAIVEDLNDSTTPTMSEHHRNLFWRVIDRIEGNLKKGKK